MKDLIIIGGGPTGINCAIEAKRANLDYVVLEKGVLVNSLFHFPANMTFFSTSQNLEIGDVPFISHQDKPTRQEALEYYRRIIEHYQLQMTFGVTCTDVRRERDHFDVYLKRGQTLQAKHVIIATGFYDIPRKLNIPGEELAKVKHYYDEVHYYIRKKVVVIGGANSACDVALECWQKGAEVTMVVRKSDLYEKVKYWILPNVKNRIEEGSIKAYFSSTLSAIRADEVDIQTPNGIITIDNDFVLAMTGYRPDMEFLYRSGIQLLENNIPHHDEKTLMTNVEGLYVAGVVAGGDLTSKLFIENTRHHAALIIQAICARLNR